MPMTTFG